MPNYSHGNGVALMRKKQILSQSLEVVNPETTIWGWIQVLDLYSDLILLVMYPDQMQISCQSYRPVYQISLRSDHLVVKGPRPLRTKGQE